MYILMTDEWEGAPQFSVAADATAMISVKKMGLQLKWFLPTDDPTPCDMYFLSLHLAPIEMCACYSY